MIKIHLTLSAASHTCCIFCYSTVVDDREREKGGNEYDEYRYIDEWNEVQKSGV